MQLTGADALALGAVAAGVGCITSYPGSPSAATVRALFSLRRSLVNELPPPHIEWSVNERVALEVGIGFSLAGRRTLVCTKSVGFNVMIDTLMTLNLTPLAAGMVILLGDDPGAYGSQNDQDSRPLAELLELPMLELREPVQAWQVLQEAFTAGERFGLPVVLRITRSFEGSSVAASAVPQPARWEMQLQPAPREPLRFFPFPGNAVAKHRQLHHRLEQADEWADSHRLNRCTGAATAENAVGGSTDGVLAAGFCATKLRDVLGEVPALEVLQLATVYPIPRRVLAGFMARHPRVLLLEENEPFIELRAAAVAQQNRIEVELYGKLTGHVARGGELYRWQMCSALRSFAPSLTLLAEYDQADEAGERPPRHGYCAECPLDQIMDAVEAATSASQLDPWLVADPGCLAAQAERLHAKYALGSALAVSDGLARAGAAALALFGDSSFFHSALPALCNAVAMGSRFTALVIDNGGAVTTGGQPHPGIPRPVRPALSIARIAEACGVRRVQQVAVAALRDALLAALAGDGVQLVVVEVPCTVAASYSD